MEELQADAAALREEGVRVPPRHLPAAAAAEAACPQVPITGPLLMFQAGIEVDL